METTKIFFDTEFTGLHQESTLISIGLVSEDNRTFYAEFTDYDKKQVDEWINLNVISNLLLTNYQEKDYDPYGKHIKVKGDTEIIEKALTRWFRSFGDVEMWGDCLSYDWVLFNQIWGHAFNIPKNIYYIPFDICILFKIKGIDVDITREEFIGESTIVNSIRKNFKNLVKHNALWDAYIIKECYNKVIKI